jgi:predicted nucleic acid-binding protein
MADVLLIQVHRRRIVFEEAEAFLRLIGEMAIGIDVRDKRTMLNLPYLAREHHLTGFDAAFLELAIRLELPFATSDQAIMRAAAAARVPLLHTPG